MSEHTDEVLANLSPSEAIHMQVSRDVTNRTNWEHRQRRWRRKRLRERNQKRRHYPGYPNFLEPIIDDNVNDLTDAETSIFFSGSRNLASFMPLDQKSVELKRNMEVSFDYYLRILLDKRSTIEGLMDTKNVGGMSIAKMTLNADIIPGELVPDFDMVDPLDLIVPVGTRRLAKAERIAHAIRFTEREFRNEAEARDWDNVDKVIKAAKDSESNMDEDGASRGRHQDQIDIGSDPGLDSLNKMATSLSWINVWEIYHYNDKREKVVTILAPVVPELTLSSFPWIYEPKELPVGGSDEVALQVEDRSWPFVQFRKESRSPYYYDTRGLGETLLDNQKAATQMKNVTGVNLDFSAMPFYRGSKATGTNFKFRPGSHVPNDFEIVKGPSLDLNIEALADRERAIASRRAGSPKGSLSTVGGGKTPKTAREVSSADRSAGMTSSNSVMRFTEPLGELLHMMWEYIKNNPVDLPGSIAGNFIIVTAAQIRETNYKVIPTISSRNANPDFIMAQLIGLTPLLQNNPFIKQAEFTKFMIDQIDPMITEMIVVDPEGGDSPIEQQVQGLQKAVEGIVNILRNQNQTLEANANADMEAAAQQEQEQAVAEATQEPVVA